MIDSVKDPLGPESGEVEGFSQSCGLDVGAKGPAAHNNMLYLNFFQSWSLKGTVTGWSIRWGIRVKN